MLNARPEGRCQAPQPRSGAPKAQGLIAALRPQHNPPCRRSRSPAASPPADRFESVARAHLLAAALMPAEPHIRSPFTERLAPQSLILEVIGLGRVGPHCISAYRSHCLRRPARPDPTRLIRPRGTAIMIPLSRMPQTGFVTAPAGISPWVTYLQRAMSSLRASATIEMRRVRPRSEPTRWRNQQLRALSGWYLTTSRQARPLSCADADCLPSRCPVRGRCCHSSMGWEPGLHRLPIAVGSRNGGTDPQGRAR